MTLAQRLLLAIGALSLATIIALGFGVREACTAAKSSASAISSRKR